MVFSTKTAKDLNIGYVLWHKSVRHKVFRQMEQPQFVYFNRSRISIPKNIQRSMKLKDGTAFFLQCDETQIILRKIEPEKLLNALKGGLK